MRTRIAIVAIALALVLVGIGRATEYGYDASGKAAWAFVFSFDGATDSTIVPGFLYELATVTRVDADLIVTPVGFTTAKLTDNSSALGRSPNPRAGEPMTDWGPDTLTADEPTTVICCVQFEKLRIQALGSDGRARIYLSAKH